MLIEAVKCGGPPPTSQHRGKHEREFVVESRTSDRAAATADQSTDRVLSVLHPPSAALARIMEQAGCEVGFVGTGGVVGGYTGLADVGALTMLECVQVAGWIAQSVTFPVIMDGDTGHGGIMAVRRMVRECIRAGHAHQ